MTTGDTLLCVVCKERKPRDDFYPSRSRRGGRSQRCITCDNSRNRQTPARILRTRARQRATAALVAEHAERFHELYEHCLDIVRDEYEILQGQPEAQDHPGQPVRLRSGPAREGEDLLDRIDVGRCEHCATAHRRGHVCPACHASPERVGVPTVGLTREELLEDLTWILDNGETHVERVAARLGTTPDALERRLHRMGRSDLFARLTDVRGIPKVGAA